MIKEPPYSQSSIDAEPSEPASPYLKAVSEIEAEIEKIRAEDHGLSRTLDGRIEEDSRLSDLKYAAAINSYRAKTLSADTEKPLIMTPEGVRVLKLGENPKLRAQIKRYVEEYEAAKLGSDALETEDDEKVILPMSLDEQREVNFRMREPEVLETLDELNKDSLKLLDENPTNNSGIGDSKFAVARYNATIYGLRALDLAKKHGLLSDEREALEEREATLFEESLFWERIAVKKEIVHADEASPKIRKYVKELREAYRYKPEVGDQHEPDLLDQIPEDENERRRFKEQTFAEYNPEKLDLFKAYITKEIRDWASMLPPNSRCADTVAAVVGNGVDEAMAFIAHRISSVHGGKEISKDQLLGMRFSSVCKNYLGLNVFEVMPDYDQKFDTTQGREDL